MKSGRKEYLPSQKNKQFPMVFPMHMFAVYFPWWVFQNMEQFLTNFRTVYLKKKTTTVRSEWDGNIFLVLQALTIDDGVLGQYTAIIGQFYSHTTVIKTTKAEIFGWPLPSWKDQVCKMRLFYVTLVSSAMFLQQKPLRKSLKRKVWKS